MATIKKIPPPEPPPATVEIQLTEREAQGLCVLLSAMVSVKTLEVMGLVELSDRLDALFDVSETQSFPSPQRTAHVGEDATFDDFWPARDVKGKR